MTKNLIKTLAAFLLIITLNAVCFAAETQEHSFEVTAEADKSKINVGDRIKLKIMAENPVGLEVVFPETPENMGDFSFIESRAIEIGQGSSYKTGREYLISIYDTGTHVIPPLDVKYKKTNETDWNIIKSPQVSVEVESLLREEDKDIRDLKGLAAFGMDLFWIILILSLALVLAAVVWILRHRKTIQNKGTECEKVRSAYEIAYEELCRLKSKNLPEQGCVKEYYITLSAIVRRYLENRFSFRAPEMTTQEFMESIKVSPDMLDEHKKLLKDFLFHCDMVKFAKYGPKPIEMVDSFQAAFRLIKQTKIIQEKEAEE